MINKIHFGKRLAYERKSLGITQTELAEQLFVTPQAVSKWERELCYPDIFLLPDLSKLIGVSVDELLGKVTTDIS